LSRRLVGNPNKSEEEYYTSDYTEKEKEQGLHKAVLNWVSALANLVAKLKA
jgi:hypothetical protein